MGFKTRKSRAWRGEAFNVVEPNPAKRKEIGVFQPRNCPIGERSGDGTPLGPCWHWLGDDGNTCPIHGDVSKETWIAFKREVKKSRAEG